jgi:D-aminoacyl-tRNA deacylase
MRAVLQRVSDAGVTVAGEEIAAIGCGLVILLGVFPDDTEADADWLVDKSLDLRIFPDAEKPMNRSVIDVDGEVLVVSQFTLAADTTRGKRPGFSTAAPPELAEHLYRYFVERMQGRWPKTVTGRFGADMQVRLTNDGPVTFLLER